MKKLFDELFAQGLQLVTGIKENMKSKRMPLFNKIILRKRSMIESINKQLKNVFQIEHTRLVVPSMDLSIWFLVFFRLFTMIKS